MKKIGKAIAKKFKNWKTTTSKETVIQEPSISSSTGIEQQPTVVTAKATTHAIDKATETDTKLCNINREDLQPICESSEEAQIENTVEPTSVDRETNEQEPNTSNSPSSTACFDSTVDEKSSKKAMLPIVAGVVGAVLLVSCVASYLLIEYSKVQVIALIGGIIVHRYRLTSQQKNYKNCSGYIIKSKNTFNLHPV